MRVEKIVEIGINNFGGSLGGSRFLGTHEKHSDYDMFFTDIKQYRKFLTLITELKLERRVMVERIIKHPNPTYKGARDRTVMEEIRRDGIEGPSLDVVLVEKLLPRKEQLQMHIKKHPEKIQKIMNEISRKEAEETFMKRYG